jgi:hypothetical protein
MGKVLVVFILDVSLSAILSLESKLIAATYTPSPLHPIEIISLEKGKGLFRGTATGRFCGANIMPYKKTKMCSKYLC